MTDEELSKCLSIEAERDIALNEIERLRELLHEIAAATHDFNLLAQIEPRSK